MATRKLGFAELVKAVIARLNADALTSGYDNYGYVPPTATFPYNVIGGPIGVRSPSFGSRDTEAESNAIHVHTWSDYQGDKEVTQMQDNIVQAMTGTALSITGYTAPFQVLLDYADVLDDDTDPNERLKHGIIRFRVEMAPS